MSMEGSCRLMRRSTIAMVTKATIVWAIFRRQVLECTDSTMAEREECCLGGGEGSEDPGEE